MSNTKIVVQTILQLGVGGPLTLGVLADVIASARDRGRTDWEFVDIEQANGRWCFTFTAATPLATPPAAPELSMSAEFAKQIEAQKEAMARAGLPASPLSPIDSLNFDPARTHVRPDWEYNRDILDRLTARVCLSDCPGHCTARGHERHECLDYTGHEAALHTCLCGERWP